MSAISSSTWRLLSSLLSATFASTCAVSSGISPEKYAARRSLVERGAIDRSWWTTRLAAESRDGALRLVAMLPPTAAKVTPLAALSDAQLLLRARRCIVVVVELELRPSRWIRLKIRPTRSWTSKRVVSEQTCAMNSSRSRSSSRASSKVSESSPLGAVVAEQPPRPLGLPALSTKAGAVHAIALTAVETGTRLCRCRLGDDIMASPFSALEKPSPSSKGSCWSSRL
mmetsp:Transcript_48486/g.105457  ORF Transcript_48486/g.105457 Transcript_48486/m.105457 type:complete len:227 (-) Transcript_48486:108-788(-)